jgi:hypothetical protein
MNCEKQKISFLLNPNYKEKILTFLKIVFNDDSHLTVCVTRAGAGGGTPSNWKKAEV